MSFAEEFRVLFLGMSPWVMALLIVGVVFLVIEIFTAGFGFFGIAGGVMEVVAIVLRAIKGDGNPGAQAAILLLLTVLICLLAFGLMVLLTKLGILKRTPLMSTGVVVKGRSQATRDHSGLLGKQGVCRTDLHPVGKAEIEGEVYDVVADDFLTRGTPIKVIAVEGVKISVVKR